MATAGEGLMHKAVRELDSAKADAVAERRELAAMIGTLGAVKAMGMVGLDRHRGVPFGPADIADVDACVAFWVGRARRGVHHEGGSLECGRCLMEAQGPQAWRTLSDAVKLTGENQAACREAAVKTKKEQHCSIVMPAPWVFADERRHHKIH